MMAQQVGPCTWLAGAGLAMSDPEHTWLRPKPKNNETTKKPSQNKRKITSPLRVICKVEEGGSEKRKSLSKSTPATEFHLDLY